MRFKILKMGTLPLSRLIREKYCDRQVVMRK